MNAQSNTPAPKFSGSDTKYGLWVPNGVTRDGQPLEGLDSILVQMFVLNGDSEKAREDAAAVMAIEGQIARKANFVFQAAKADGTRHEYSVTGEQVIARAKAILSIGSTEVAPKILAVGTKASSTRKTATGVNRLAGLLQTAPAPVTPNTGKITQVATAKK